MAYRRSRKPFYRRKRFVRGVKTAFNVATKALKTAAMVKSLINVEYKCLDNYNPTTVLPTGAGSVGNIILQTGIPQGDSYDERNGNSVKLKSLYTRGLFSLDVSIIPHCDIRLMMFRDNEGVYSTGTAIAPHDLLQNSTYFLSPINLNNGKRFKVLYDRTLSLDASNPTRMFKLFRKFGQHLRFTGPASIDTDEGHIYIAAFVDSATAMTNALTWNYNTRIRYIDN